MDTPPRPRPRRIAPRKMPSRVVKIAPEDAQRLGTFVYRSNSEEWTREDQEDAELYLRELKTRREASYLHTGRAEEGIDNIITVMEAVVEDGHEHLATGYIQIRPRFRTKMRKKRIVQRRRERAGGRKWMSLTLGANLDEWSERFGASKAITALAAGVLLYQTADDDDRDRDAVARAAKLLVALPNELHVTLLLHHAVQAGITDPHTLADQLGQPRSTALLENPRFASALERLRAWLGTEE